MAWINSLLYFLRRRLRNPQRRSVKILESYYGDHVVVLRLQDSGIPGAVDLWRIDRHYERIRFFVCLVSLSALKQDLRLSQYRAASSSARSSGLAERLSYSLAEQRHIAASHFWITGWDVEFSGTDAQGRNYRSSRLTDLAILAVDLQGASGPFAGDRYAARFARKVIVQLAANDFREYGRHRTWSAAVKSIDWLPWIESLTRAKDGGIATDHVLQPRHSRIKIVSDGG